MFEFRQLHQHAWLLVATLILFSQSAQALPTFAQQTGQSCVACHAGGQFPELTPYGRLFKLTAYTNGTPTNPLALMWVGDWTKTANNNDGNGGVISDKNKQPISDFASVFVAGKITENLGGFAQFTYNVAAGHSHSDNTDVRYADLLDTPTNNLIWGVTLHNNPTVQDVWNTQSAWGYPYINSSTGAFSGLPYSTISEQQLQLAGTGVYAYFNKNWYAEFTTYETAKNAFQILSLGSKTGDANYPLTYLRGLNPYFRLAYTYEWGSQNLMIGFMGLDFKVLPLDASNRPFGHLSTHYKDTSIDAQYQYLLEPHTFTTSFRYIRERINDEAQATAYSGPATLNSSRIKSSYVYQSRYGVSLAFLSITGSPDLNAYGYGTAISGSNNGIPNSRMWTPEIFYMPLQNIRVGIQYNYFSGYNGASQNYDGFGRNANANNTTFAYIWGAF